MGRDEERSISGNRKWRTKQISAYMPRLVRNHTDKIDAGLTVWTLKAPIDILTGMKGVRVFIAIAIIADIIEVSRFAVLIDRKRTGRGQAVPTL